MRDVIIVLEFLPEILLSPMMLSVICQGLTKVVPSANIYLLKSPGNHLWKETVILYSIFSHHRSEIVKSDLSTYSKSLPAKFCPLDNLDLMIWSLSWRF